MYSSPPVGETPPSPGLEREEPELMVEEDIPTDDNTIADAEMLAQDDGDRLRQVERE